MKVDGGEWWREGEWLNKIVEIKCSPTFKSIYYHKKRTNYNEIETWTVTRRQFIKIKVFKLDIKNWKLAKNVVYNIMIINYDILHLFSRNDLSNLYAIFIN